MIFFLPVKVTYVSDVCVCVGQSVDMLGTKYMITITIFILKFNYNTLKEELSCIMIYWTKKLICTHKHTHILKKQILKQQPGAHT